MNLQLRQFFFAVGTLTLTGLSAQASLTTVDYYHLGEADPSALAGRRAMR